MLTMQIKDLGLKPTDTQLLAIARKREQLAANISTFNASAVQFVGRVFDHNNSILIENTLWDESDHDDYVDDADGIFGKVPVDGATEDGSAGISVECAFICLLSAIGLELCKLADADDLIQQEIQLRIGQANNALHELQLSLVDKAILCRTKVQDTKSQHTKGRAWDKLTGVQNIVRHHSIISKCGCSPHTIMSLEHGLYKMRQTLIVIVLHSPPYHSLSMAVNSYFNPSTTAFTGIFADHWLILHYCSYCIKIAVDILQKGTPNDHCWCDFTAELQLLNRIYVFGTLNGFFMQLPQATQGALTLVTNADNFTNDLETFVP
ncbi:hypothetical protein JVU11DRAFT_10610 [Chiua virens]|nr:hypothetical protein JVU11DRAFT_10610 [Chiua virens]